MYGSGGMSKEIKINVYDFDKTIYAGDVSFDFYKFCLVKNPALLKYLPVQIYALCLYILDIQTKTQTKQALFSFLRSIDNADDLVNKFWNTHNRKLYKHLVAEGRTKNIIATASPEFLVNYVENTFADITVIGTKMNPKNGHITGKNCYGNEKVSRLNHLYGRGGYIINICYSDSLSDRPLLELSKRPGLVRRGVVLPYSDAPMQSFYSTYTTTEFIRFILVGGINVLIGVVASYLIFLLSKMAVVSFLLGYAISLSISYFLNTYITFKENRVSLRKYAVFCLSYIPNFAIQLISITVCVHILHLPALLAYIFAAVLGVFITFTLLKQFTFKRAGLDA